MKTILLQMIGGALAALILLAIGVLIGYGYAHWEADFETSADERMDEVTSSCIRDGLFFYKGYAYDCSLDEAQERGLDQQIREAQTEV